MDACKKNCLATQAMKAIISLIKLQGKIGYFEYADMFKLFDTMINNNKFFRSFKSKENNHKKEVGPYRGLGY